MLSNVEFKNMWSFTSTTRTSIVSKLRMFGLNIEKLIEFQLVKELASYYRIRSFNTVVTSARHWCLSWARWIWSSLSHPIL